MVGNETMLTLWNEAFCGEMEELLGSSVQAQETDAAQSGKVYRTQLLVEGFVQGVLHVTAPAAHIVSFAQLAAGDMLHTQSAWTEETLESWRRLLDGTATRLATRLSKEYAEGRAVPCSILLAETSTMEDIYPAAESGTSASGSKVQHWLLQVGAAQIAMAVSVNVEFMTEMSESIDPLASIHDSLSDAENNTLEAADLEPAMSPPPSEVAGDDNRTQEVAAQASPSASLGGIPAPSSSHEETIEMEQDHPLQEQNQGSARAGMSQERIDLLLDIELGATLRFGALELPLREVLELGPGDVLPLDRHVREPVDLVVGDRIVARGEVVLVAGNFGLHITEVAEPRKRLETIRCLF